MPIPVVRIEAQTDQLYCPLTGEPVYGNEGVRALPSLLFVYHGNAAEYAHVSESLGIDVSSLSPEQVAERLDLKACFVLEIDTGWNGVNSYCFCVPSD